MIDVRMKKLADVIVGYSTGLQKGEKILIDAFDVPREMVNALVARVYEAGGLPFVQVNDLTILRKIRMQATEEQLAVWSDNQLELMQNMDAYVALRGGANITELSDVPEEKAKLYQQYAKPVLDYRVNHTKWVVLRWPTPAMAQLASTSTEAFEDFYFDVCTVDYSKMAESIKPLKSRMEQADQVKIVGGNDTDITFSIKDIPVIPCVGERNVPDGECYTAPVLESVNGVMHYNTSTVYQGKPFDDVRLEIENGKIIAASSSDTEGLNHILDSDEGARYIGEFAFGFNPLIMNAMRDPLFDEKIAGSIHFTPGNAYEEADNGNRSRVHWDMVLVQRPEYGGGEIYFDGELIRKDGLFVPDDLQVLNPENLV